MIQTSLSAIRKHGYYLLVAIPIFYLLLGFYFNHLTGFYFNRSVDSEYIYFINGLSLAQGKILLGHIDNPATPLQYLVGIVFKIVYLFRNPNIPIAEDAILNSEVYLKVANLTYITFIATFLFLIANFVHKKFNNLSLALVIQTTPFITSLSIDNLPRFAPETFLIIPIILLSILVFGVYYNWFNEKDKKLAILAGIVIGFTLSIKITAIPLIILPFFFLIRRYYHIYIATSIISFFTIALPVTFQLERFYFWIKKIVSHSGQHGQGKAGLIDSSTFIPNIQKLLVVNELFFTIIALFFLVSIVGFVLYKRLPKTIIKINIGTSLILLLLLFMVGRQFEYRYFVPALYMFPLIVFLLTITASLLIFKKHNKVFINLLFVSSILFVLNMQLPNIPSKTRHISTDVSRRMQTYCFVQTLPKDTITIIGAEYSGTPYKEYALMFTGAYAGKYPNQLYKPLLGELYPKSYLYHIWDHTFHQWGEPLKIDKSGLHFFLYLPKTKYLDQTIGDIKKIIPINLDIKTEQIFLNDKNTNAVYTVEVIDKKQN